MFMDFLEHNGFGNFDMGMERWLVRLKKNIIGRVKEYHVNMFAKEYLRTLPEKLEHGFTRQDLIKLFHKEIHYLVNKNQLHTLKLIEPKYKKDTATCAFKFFKNCFVEVTKDKIQCHDYGALDAVIWESQIIDKVFAVVSSEECGKSEFCKFIFNCMRQDQLRYTSLVSILGYLSHNYKDPANAKAIIYCDEDVSENPDGGSGKSLTGYAGTLFNKTAIEDGRTFKPTLAFAFQQIEHDSKVIWIDDAAKKFDIEPLFTPITNGIIVEKKYQGKILIPFADSPKFLITTNYMIMGMGRSFERRMTEIEYSSHYNESNTPEDEFGHRLFDDWNDEQWLLFNNFMLSSIQLFLNQGIIPPPKININERKLLQATSKEFVDFADTLPKNKEFDKASIFQTFIAQHPEFDKLRQPTFTRWLKTYAYYKKDVTFTDRHNNSIRYFTLLTPPAPITNSQ